MHLSRTFMPDLAGGAHAARSLADALPVRAAVVRDDARAIIAELASNAGRHAGTAFTVTVCASAHAVTIEVHDGSAVHPVRLPLDAEAATGRGLHIVDGLADDWGSRPDEPSGKTVWARLDLPDER